MTRCLVGEWQLAVAGAADLLSRVCSFLLANTGTLFYGAQTLPFLHSSSLLAPLLLWWGATVGPC